MDIPTTRRPRGGGGGSWIRSKPDYFLIRKQDRRKIKICRWVLPPHHNSDHRALIVKVGGEPGGVKQFIKERMNIPDDEKTPAPAEQTEGERMFEILKYKLNKPERRDLPENSYGE